MVRRHSGGRGCFRIRILYGCNARTNGRPSGARSAGAGADAAVSRPIARGGGSALARRGAADTGPEGGPESEATVLEFEFLARVRTWLGLPLPRFITAQRRNDGGDSGGIRCVQRPLQRLPLVSLDNWNCNRKIGTAAHCPRTLPGPGN